MHYFISRPGCDAVATLTFFRFLLLQWIAQLACAKHIITIRTTLTTTVTVITSTTTITLSGTAVASTSETETSSVRATTTAGSATTTAGSATTTAGSATTTAGLATTTAGLATTTAGPAVTMTASIRSQATSLATSTSSSSQAFESAVLNSTNYYRAQHQAEALTWDSELASYAANYSSGCIWRHSGGPYGENLAEGYPTVAAAIDAWADEEEHYNYEKAKFSEKTGHFTQLVWQNTTSVGCGFIKCDISGPSGAKGMYLVCEYEPRGNVAGQYQTEVRKPGESSDGVPGLGAAPGLDLGRARILGALAAACVIVASL